MRTRCAQRLIRRSSAAAWLLLATPMLIAQGTTPSTLAPASTPAHQISDLSIFDVTITGGIFLGVEPYCRGGRHFDVICPQHPTVCLVLERDDGLSNSIYQVEEPNYMNAGT
jgi:hypothetical protein